MIVIDARGMRCPWPAIRLARALRDGAAAVEVLADDPAAPRELAAVAVAQGFVMKIVANERFKVETARNLNALFTDVA